MRSIALRSLVALAGCAADMNIGDKPMPQQGSSDESGTAVADDGATVTSGGGDDSTGASELADCELLGAGPGADPRYQWTLHCGGPAIEDVAAIAVAADGTAYVALSFFQFEVDGPAAIRIGDEVYDNGGRGDIVVLAIDTAGGVLWSRHIGGESDLAPRSLSLCGDALVLAGNNASDGIATDFGTGPTGGAGFVAALATAGGATSWVQTFGSYPQQPSARTACGPDGAIAVFGELDGAITIGGTQLDAAGLSDGYVAVLAADGSLRWSRAFGDARNQYAGGAAFDDEGGLVLAATIAGSADFGGGVLVADGVDAVVAAYDADGTLAWTRQSLGAGVETALRLVVTDDGTAVVVGGFDVDVDFGGGVIANMDTVLPPDRFGNPSPPAQDVFFAALDGTGVHRWSGRVGAEGPDVPLSLASRGGDARLSYFSGAGVLEVVDLHDGIATTELSFASDFPWADVGIDPTGATVIAASSGTISDLGSGPIASRGNADLLVARFGP